MWLSREPLPHRLAADQQHLPLSILVPLHLVFHFKKQIHDLRHCLFQTPLSLKNKRVREGVPDLGGENVSSSILTHSLSRRTSEPRKSSYILKRWGGKCRLLGLAHLCLFCILLMYKRFARRISGLGKCCINRALLLGTFTLMSVRCFLVHSCFISAWKQSSGEAVPYSSTVIPPSLQV